MSADIIKAPLSVAIQHARDSIVAIDPHTLERGCLARVLASEFQDYDIVETDSVAALSRSTIGRPRLVILRIHPERQSDAAIADELADIRRICPDASIALVCDDPERSLHYAIQHGCNGYLPTSSPLEIAVAALRLVLVGGQYLPQPARPPVTVMMEPRPAHQASVEDNPVVCAVIGKGSDISAPVFAEPCGASQVVACPASLSGILTSPMEKAATFDFTPREREVIEALRCGRSNKVIASDLNLSENTVKVHVRHIMRKLRATNRTQAALRSQLLFSSSGSVN
jgi:DNA-binding NarL/FixJ family response regulator